MKVIVKLFATLIDYLPDGSHGNQVAVDVDDHASVGEILERFRLPEQLTHLVLINGNYVAPAARPTRRLNDGDHLAVWPPIAGG